jgi:hypothetical protein
MKSSLATLDSRNGLAVTIFGFPFDKVIISNENNRATRRNITLGGEGEMILLLLGLMIFGPGMPTSYLVEDDSLLRYSAV